MSKFLTGSMAAAALTLAVSLSSPVLADGPAADPTVHQIYEAAQAGHLDQAQTMMDQVLRDHPGSAKAHYVQAELFAREGRTQEARSELARAEEIEPGLPHEKPQSVQALKSQLGMLPRGGQGGHVIGMTAVPAPTHASFPWGLLLIVVGAIVVLYLVFRPRQTVYAGGAVVGGGGGGAGYAPGYGGPGYGGPGMGGGGIGSGIAGGLASGLAVGAGVVAGEELAHHFLDGGRSEGVAPQQIDNGGWDQPSSNSDMGGSDFGVNDPGSWDDSGGGGGGGGGGDDWT
jgi:hypothetical protein